MRILFGEYELLANSGLFDAAYYLRSNPDVAEENIDPLLHYLERGCHERRDPSADFDTAHYLKLCDALGEAPSNALAHYLNVGMGRGLSPKADSRRRRARKPGARVTAAPTEPRIFTTELMPLPDPPTPAVHRMYIDIPRVVDGVAAAPRHGGLSIVGWGAMPGGVAGVEIALDGGRIATARCQLRRPDVAAAHPELEDALLSGFAAHLPPKVLPVGRHQITVSMRGCRGDVARNDFQLDVEETAGDSGSWTLRRKMSQAEVDLKLLTLARLRHRPRFCVYLTVDPSARGIAAARRTLASLARQKYGDWNVHLVLTGEPIGHGLAALAARLRKGLGDHPVRDRISWGASRARAGRGVGKLRSDAGRVFVARLRAGDTMGCDALLEFALRSAVDPDVDLLYADEIRSDPVDGKAQAFFKPGWSPDLLSSTNYLGRAWVADAALVARAGIAAGRIGVMADYEITLRLTETARRIGHIPKVLHQREDARADSPRQERQALAAALRRRAITAEIHASALEGYYRIKRAVGPGRVSIIIPTCAAHGHIRTCLQTLRAVTAYPDYEIICIENIPSQQQEDKAWLRNHADVVIEALEPFNWSRYNNRAAEAAGGIYLLFLNDDVEITEPDWLEVLVGQAGRPEVGVVGALLLYPDRSVQQAGMMLDGRGRGRHAFRHLDERDPGYFGFGQVQRNVLAVTGACLLTRRDTFDALGGFDEAHAVINNDLDYCLRARRRGLINLYEPHAKLIHHELASRGHLEENYDSVKFREQWREIVAAGDPYFNRNLSRDHEPFTIEREPFQVVHAGHPLFARDSVRRILVLKLDHIGDCITALPAARRLKMHFPRAHLTVLAARATLALWQAEPLVDEVLEFNFFHARSGAGKVPVDADQLRRLGEQLQIRNFNLAIDLRKQPDTRHLLQHTGADLMVGFDSHGRFPWLDVALEWDEDVPLRTKHGHVSDDLITLVDAVATQSEPARPPILPRPKGSLKLAADLRRRLFAQPLICVHPAAGSPMRQWPSHHFADLIYLLLNRHRCHVALLGGQDEGNLAQEISASVGRQPGLFNLVGRLTLAELPLVICRAALFVGNNSGPHHMAAALGIPTVGIHSGVVDAREWGPMGPKAVAVRRDMTCSPCFLEHPQDCPRQLECLTQLSVSDVYETCRSLGAEALSPT